MEENIWVWYRGFNKAYTEDGEKKRQIEALKGCKVHCSYHHLNGRLGWDLIFPTRLYNKVARILGLPSKVKNPNRIKHGKKMGRLAVEKDRLGIKKGVDFSNN